MTPPIERKIKKLIIETTFIEKPNNLIVEALGDVSNLVRGYKSMDFLTEEEASELVKDIKYRQENLPAIRL